MYLFEIIKNRRSVRKFEDKDLPKEMIEKLIEAIIWAPSAGNLQARKFYFVYNDGIKNKIAELCGQNWVAQAPLVAVACADKEQSAFKYGQQGRDLYSIIDTSLSIQNLMLQAFELGLGSTPVGAFDESELAELFDMDSDLKPILVIPIGFPAENPAIANRVSYNEAVKEIK